MPPDTKERIVYAAMLLFARKGYASTSVADILHDADVNAGSLYHFFPGKQDVLLAVLDAYRNGIHPMLLAPAWKGVPDPIERVFALLAHYRGTSPIPRCARSSPRTSTAGSRQSSAASSTRGIGSLRNSTAAPSPSLR